VGLLVLGKSEVDAYITQVKAYGELPENAKINETDAFGEEDSECTFEFGDDGEVDIDDI
jgi:translation initiation factor 1A